MQARNLIYILAILSIIVVMTVPAKAYVAYDTHVMFLNTVNKDLIKLLPRAMGSFIYHNRRGFMRGLTFMVRDIRSNPLKQKDLEEVRREAYARLSRDIPYCVEAFKGSDIKLDTSASNLSARLGMIAYSIILVKIPAFPDLVYLESFSRTFDSVIAESLIDLWLFYDGYGDFHSFGELMERLKPDGMPKFAHVRNDRYPIRMREDPYGMFRAPDKFNRRIILTDVDVNNIYNKALNGILDAYVYIWKCSGMDLAHPSYAAPPGTVISRASRRREVRGGVLSATLRGEEEAEEELEEEALPGLEEETEPAERPPAPGAAPPRRRRSPGD